MWAVQLRHEILPKPFDKLCGGLVVFGAHTTSGLVWSFVLAGRPSRLSSSQCSVQAIQRL
ncbi:unnamed protein product [Haemonchus placei]|uniref:Uncharacterized protein n=1 Tax=Haemonchus placei TaxID=6290 RepID=A0A3P7X420_HAEPC|nr:unnamed protein product [Haemonchus placei]